MYYPGIFGYLFIPLHLIVLIHNWIRKDNAVGFEVSPEIRWTYEEDYSAYIGQILGLEDEYEFADYD